MSRARLPGTLVSDKGNQLTPLPPSFGLNPGLGDKFAPQDVLSMPKLVASGRLYVSPLPYSVLMGSPYAAAFVSSGCRMTWIDHRACANGTHMGNSGGMGAVGGGPSQGGGGSGHRRPKNAVKNNNSTFISRGQVFELFYKRMKEPDLSENLVVLSYERSLVLLDLAPNGVRIETLAKIFFSKEWPLCHALNTRTCSAGQLDVIVGMSSGDLVWLDFVSLRYERLNKIRNVSHAPITAVEWLPNSESLVMAAHMDGMVVIYDVHAEDSSFVPGFNGETLSLGMSDANDKKQTVKAVYRISPKPITGLEFISPSKLAVSAQSGYISLFELQTEQVTELLPTLFGGSRCLSHSADGRFLAAGGEDDMISVFDLAKGTLAARLQGHRATVRSVDFDYFQSQPEFSTGVYRLASVGDDRQLLLWNFAPMQLQTSRRQPNTTTLCEDQARAQATHQLPNSSILVHGRVPHPQVKLLAPVAAITPAFAEFGDSPLSDVQFTAYGLMVASSDGRVWSWRRVPGNY